jgi:asparagine synthase (glutamine-hydrolysing)
MCGLVGVLAPSESGRQLLDRVAAMSGTIAHRGPDDSGVWRDDAAGVALGHQRLAVVDLSPEGHQPMVSADGRWVLVFNGEVYDHADHRRRLLDAGVRFHGRSDTEVLLELIARDGPAAAFRAVDAMFALAVWDRRDRVLTLARDRVGEKPLVYGQVGGAIAFGSELRAVRCLPGAPSDLDPAAVADYLRLGFVPAPRTILAGVHKVPAGSLVQITANGSVGEPQPYWSLRDVAAAGAAAAADGPWAERVEDALRRSVARRLVADVPVGAFLSGGLDSSTVVAIAQQVSPTPVRTFTVAVGGAGDESVAAAAVAAHLGTDHTTLDLPETAALDLATRMADVYDEPFADPSGIPTAVLCAATRRHVTVALSGDGADELFGGYNRYRVAARGGVGRLLALPVPARRVVASALRSVSPEGWDRALARLPGDLGRVPAAGDKAHKLAGALRAPTRLAAYDALAQLWDSAGLLVGASEPGRTGARERAGAGGLGLLGAMLLADQQVVLPDDMLVKVDRASMAVALEVRVPFLSPELVELSWTMPDEAKIRDGRGKQVVRDVLGRHVPGELWDRPKTGFDPPLAGWLRGPLREWAGDLLAPDRVARQGLLRPDVVGRTWQEHLSGRRNHDYRLWALLMLEGWLADGAAAPAARHDARRPA